MLLLSLYIKNICVCFEIVDTIAVLTRFVVAISVQFNKN